MAFTLWNLFEASILILNAVCVLHEERFLAKKGRFQDKTLQAPSILGLTVFWAAVFVALYVPFNIIESIKRRGGLF